MEMLLISIEYLIKQNRSIIKTFGLLENKKKPFKDLKLRMISKRKKISYVYLLRFNSDGQTLSSKIHSAFETLFSPEYSCDPLTFFFLHCLFPIESQLCLHKCIQKILFFFVNDTLINCSKDK